MTAPVHGSLVNSRPRLVLVNSGERQSKPALSIVPESVPSAPSYAPVKGFVSLAEAVSQVVSKAAKRWGTKP